MQPIGTVFAGVRRAATSTERDCRILRDCLDRPSETSNLIPGNNVLSCIAEVIEDVKNLNKAATDIPKTAPLSALVSACLKIQQANARRLDTIEDYFEQYGYTRPPPSMFDSTDESSDPTTGEQEASAVVTTSLVRENTFTAVLDEKDSDSDKDDGKVAAESHEAAAVSEYSENFSCKDEVHDEIDARNADEIEAHNLHEESTTSHDDEEIQNPANDEVNPATSDKQAKGALESLLSDDETEELDFVSLQDIGISAATLAMLQKNDPISAAAPRTPALPKQSHLLMDSGESKNTPGTDDEIDLATNAITTVTLMPATPFDGKSNVTQEISPHSTSPPQLTTALAMPNLETESEPHIGDVFAPVTDAEYAALPRFISVTLPLPELNSAIAAIKECILATDAPASEVIFTQPQLRDDLALGGKSKAILLVLLKMQRLESRGKGDDGEPLYSFRI